MRAGGCRRGRVEGVRPRTQRHAWKHARWQFSSLSLSRPRLHSFCPPAMGGFGRRRRGCVPPMPALSLSCPSRLSQKKSARVRGSPPVAAVSMRDEGEEETRWGAGQRGGDPAPSPTNPPRRGSELEREMGGRVSLLPALSPFLPPLLHPVACVGERAWARAVERPRARARAPARLKLRGARFCGL